MIFSLLFTVCRLCLACLFCSLLFVQNVRTSVSFGVKTTNFYAIYIFLQYNFTTIYFFLPHILRFYQHNRVCMALFEICENEFRTLHRKSVATTAGGVFYY